MKGKQKPRRELFACPNCGADVPVGAAACRECGSDATTGWRDAGDVEYTSVDLPDGYRDETQSEELPPRRTPLWIVLVALLLALALVVLVATGRW